LLLLIVAMLAVYATVPLRRYLDQRADAARLERQVAQLEAQNAQLLADIAKLRDATYLERVARECLGMVKPGEIALVMEPGDAHRPPPVC
jgi:cell division protein FtsL